jgi:hypothetical protein
MPSSRENDRSGEQTVIKTGRAPRTEAQEMQAGGKRGPTMAAVTPRAAFTWITLAPRTKSRGRECVSVPGANFLTPA